MKTLYIKPLGYDRIEDLTELVALYRDDTGVINVGYPGLAPYKPVQANMFGFNDAYEKALFISKDEFKDIEVDQPVYMIDVNDDNIVEDFAHLNEVGHELDTYLAGDPVVLKALGR